MLHFVRRHFASEKTPSILQTKCFLFLQLKQSKYNVRIQLQKAIRKGRGNVETEGGKCVSGRKIVVQNSSFITEPNLDQNAASGE